MAQHETQAGVTQFVSTYKALNKSNLSSLASIYHPRSCFLTRHIKLSGLAPSFSILPSCMRTLVRANLISTTPRSKAMMHLSPGQ